MRRVSYHGLMILAILVPSAAGAIHPVNLRCEYRTDPLGIDTLKPRLSWHLTAEDRAQYQRAYQIQVCTTPETLSEDKADMWDSGKVDSDQSVHVEYEGRPLGSRQHCYWRVRVWDKTDKGSAWSEPAHWSMGILRPQDWRSPWIAANNDWNPPGRRYHGYHSAPGAQTDAKWVQIDLQRIAAIEQVILHPASLRYVYEPTTFGFPLRFRIEAANDPEFTAPRVIADYTDRDYGTFPFAPQAFAAKGIKARYVRITATQLWNRDTEERPFYCLALAAVEVIADGQNVALNRPVTSLDVINNHDWNRFSLTDFRNLLDDSIPYNLEPTPYAAVMLRREVTLDQDIARATAFVCGLGYYELYVNGEKVGDHVMDPGLTDYSKRVQYVTCDVTDQLRPGVNAVGAMLGFGWHSGSISNYIPPWSATPKLRLEIDVEFKNGKTARIVSDESWTYSPSEILSNCIRGGEVIDARRRQPGWDRPGFDDRRWGAVKRVPAPAGVLVSQNQPPIRVTQSVKPVAITEPKPGVYVVDMGMNMTGWARLRITDRPGRMIRLHYNERLHPDGTLNPLNREFTGGPFQRDVFLCSGGADVFEPRFTYHGFRYIQIEGLDEKPALDTVTGRFVHTDSEQAGTFACSNDLINRQHAMCLQTIKGNIHSIPTDCPTREKLGWLQDGCVVQEAAFYNMSMATFYTKWFRDMVDTQESSGYVAPIAPDMGGNGSGPGDAPTWASGPWWSGAIVRTPWKLYQYYGDRRILEEGYEPMKKYVDYLAAHAQGHCINFGLGDWLEHGTIHPKRTPPALSNTAAYAWYAQVVSDTAALLGRQGDAEHYAALAESIRAAFNKRFLDPNKGLKIEDSQTGPALALYLGLVEPDKRPLVEAQLRYNIAQTRNHHISSGIVGTLFVYHQLTEQGDSALAYAMSTQNDCPGLGYMLGKDATTVWEHWSDKEFQPGSASMNHPALASVDAWFYRALAGIRPDPAGPGFKRFTIKPEIAGDLTWVEASYDSVYGKITSHWKRNQNRATLHVTVPVNTQARVVLPTTSNEGVRESGQPLDQHPEIRLESKTPGKMILTIGSGNYRFSFPMAE